MNFEVVGSSYHYTLYSMHVITQQVPLGILMKNEICYKNMIDIVLHHQKYVPRISSTSEFSSDVSNIDPVPVDTTTFHRVVFGGDQLTTARMRGSQLDRVTSDTGVDKLKGVILAFENWLAKVLFLQVSIINHFSLIN